MKISDKAWGIISCYCCPGMDLVKRNPDIHPLEYKGTRMHLIRRFPYKIIYVIEPERITIIAVLHSKRNPALIRERLT